MAGLGRLFAVIDLVSESTKDQRLNFRDRFFLGRAVAHRSWQRRDLSDPAPVFFFFGFNAHIKMVSSVPRTGKRLLLPNVRGQTRAEDGR